jgi:hypothetical protein
MREEPPPRTVLTRREAMLRLLVASAGVPLAATLGRWAYADEKTPGGGAAPSPSTPPSANRLGRAKSVIEIWMSGGPSHLDTFDPKPEAGGEYHGPMPAPLATKADGVRIGGLFPLLAAEADKFSLLRGMTHGSNGHETAAYIVQTGRDPEERLVYPSVGSVVTLFRAADYRGLVPPYVVLTTPQGRFSESGFLGPRYRPFVTGGDPNGRRFAVEGVVAEGLSDERQAGRRKLLSQLDTLGAGMPGNPRFDAFDKAGEKAYDLILGDAGKVFDLTQEKDAERDRYGRNTFGQSCLAARRLVESGVPYVTIHTGGWDTHKQNFETMRRRLPEIDRGLAALLSDLAARGLLEQTVVWCGGEFGRTPKVQWEAPWNGGRHHFGRCFTTLVAGGGFRGGQVVGATDRTGEDVKDRPIHPREVQAAIYELLGIDPRAKLPNAKGLDVLVAAAPPDAAPARPLAEIR